MTQGPRSKIFNVLRWFRQFRARRAYKPELHYMRGRPAKGDSAE